MNKLGVKRKPHPNPTNWQFANKACCKEMTQQALPSIVDLTQNFPDVYCQIYGNCTSNAVLACDAYYYHRNKPNWMPSTVFTYYNQRKMLGWLNEPDNGAYVETGLDAVRKYGACNSKVWANDMPYTQKPSKEAYANGLKGHEVTKYYNVKSLLQIKKALALGYPVAIAVSWAFEKYDENFILNEVTKKEANSCDRGHAIVVVGYDDEKKLFKIRNSWGKEWANNGYGYITYKTMKNVIWWDDSYAVVK